MNTTNVVVSPAIGTLAPVLGSAVFMPLDAVDVSKVSDGHHYQVSKKRGDNSKLTSSICIEVPEFTDADVRAALGYPVFIEAFRTTLGACQRGLLVSLYLKGVRTVEYSTITLAEVAASMPTAAVKLSSAGILAWYDASACDVMTLALIDRLGLEEVTEDDSIKIEQISNSMRDNLIKLAAPNPVFDDRVKKSLNWALDTIIASGMDNMGMSSKLKAKLNPPVITKAAMLDNLGAIGF